MKYKIAIIILLSLVKVGLSQNNWNIIKTSIKEDLHNIAFINDSIGFIFSYGTGNIYRTTDYGNKWSIVKQTDSIYLEEIQFINQKTGWICGENGKIFKTQDCGNTWYDLSILTNDGNLLLCDICFIDDSIGYVSGCIWKKQTMKPIFYKTNDGGLSWTEIFTNIPQMILNLGKTGNNLWGTGDGFILRINNDKEKWEYVFKDTLGIIGKIIDIKFADNKFGMGISFNGKILITFNGGESWITKGITTNRLRSIAYLGAKKWIVVGDNNNNDGSVLYNTIDNGENWEKINDFPDIHQVTLSENYIWIVGKKGLIAKRKK